MNVRLVTLILLCFCTLGAAYAAGRSTVIRVNGLPVRVDAMVRDGVTYVPLRAVAEALDCRVSYDPKSGVSKRRVEESKS